MLWVQIAKLLAMLAKTLRIAFEISDHHVQWDANQ
jgi:hypothetical protein